MMQCSRPLYCCQPILHVCVSTLVPFVLVVDTATHAVTCSVCVCTCDSYFWAPSGQLGAIPSRSTRHYYWCSFVSMSFVAGTVGTALFRAVSGV